MTEISLQKLEEKTLSFPNKALLIVVANEASLKYAEDFLVAIKKVRKEISDAFDPIIEKAHKAHKEAVGQKKRYEEPLMDAERIVKSKVGAYIFEQERIRREEEEKARKIEEERAEQARLAQQLAEQGKIDEAEQVIKEMPAPVIHVPHEVPKMTSSSVRKIWKWRPINIKLVPRELMILDSVKITQLVKSTQGQIRIPGIEVYSESSVAVHTD